MSKQHSPSPRRERGLGGEATRQTRGPHRRPITILGGGPAGLYSALLLKKAQPDLPVRVLERNPAGATYGWGVVFSDRTLAAFREADLPSYTAITEQFVLWEAIDTYYRGVLVRCGGHAFAGMARKALLATLQARAAEVGVEVRYETEVSDLAALEAESALVIAADGVNSLARRTYADAFAPRVSQGTARYIWFGTTLLLDAFTFIFRENADGFFQVHAYPFSGDTSTFIVECDEATWHRAGLDAADEAQSIAYCERLFVRELRGARLMGNRSTWISFPTVKCTTWRHGNVVLLGDSAHTAHFSIGSGTKLAMEDAIALANALNAHADLDTALNEYEATRRPAVEALQQAARESQHYFETIRRHTNLAPLPFTFHLLTRSGRISYDDLRLRDGNFGAAVDAAFADAAGTEVAGTAEAPAEPAEAASPAPKLAARPPAFASLRLRELSLPNRVVGMLPGDVETGGAIDARAMGAGLLLTPPLAVSPDGRRTPASPTYDTPEATARWQQIAAACHEHTGQAIGIVLTHAGRRGATRAGRATTPPDRPLREGAWPLLAPSAIPYAPSSQTPHAMTREAMDAVRERFFAAAQAAARAGFDLLVLRMAHGDLLASFLSPLSNVREDEYGGALANRARYPHVILDAVRAAWPKERPLAVALTLDDCARGGLTIADGLTLAATLKEHGCDLIQPSVGQTVPQATPPYRRGFLTSYCDRVRNEVGMPTLAGGYLTTLNEANTILAAGRADLCLLTPSPLPPPVTVVPIALEPGA